MCPSVKLFVRLVSDEFKEISPNIPCDNLTTKQRQALKQLRQIKNVLFKPADKGRDILVWPTAMYEREAFRQLRDHNCFERLTFNPSTFFQALLKKHVGLAIFFGYYQQIDQRLFVCGEPQNSVSVPFTQSTQELKKPA